MDARVLRTKFEISVYIYIYIPANFINYKFNLAYILVYIKSTPREFFVANFHILAEYICMSFRLSARGYIALCIFAFSVTCILHSALCPSYKRILRIFAVNKKGGFRFARRPLLERRCQLVSCSLRIEVEIR